VSHLSRFAKRATLRISITVYAETAKIVNAVGITRALLISVALIAKVFK
jgi:hypothetical protein